MTDDIDAQFKALSVKANKAIEEFGDAFEREPAVKVGVFSGILSIGAFIYVGMKKRGFFGGFENRAEQEHQFNELGMRQKDVGVPEEEINNMFDGDKLLPKYKELSIARQSMFRAHPFVIGLYNVYETQQKTESKYSDNQRQGVEKVFKLLEKADLRDYIYSIIQPLPQWNDVVVNFDQKVITNFCNALIAADSFNEQGGLFLGHVENGNLYIDEAIPILNDEDVGNGMLTSKYKFDEEDFYENIWLSLVNGKKLVGTWHVHPPYIGIAKVANGSSIAVTCDQVPSNADKEAWSDSVDRYNQVSAIINMSPEKDLNKMCIFYKSKAIKSIPMKFKLKA